MQVVSLGTIENLCPHRRGCTCLWPKSAGTRWQAIIWASSAVLAGRAAPTGPGPSRDGLKDRPGRKVGNYTRTPGVEPHVSPSAGAPQEELDAPPTAEAHREELDTGNYQYQDYRDYTLTQNPTLSDQGQAEKREGSSKELYRGTARGGRKTRGPEAPQQAVSQRSSPAWKQWGLTQHHTIPCQEHEWEEPAQ